MTRSQRVRRFTGGIDSWMTIAAYALAFLMIAFATQMHAQVFTVLHSFSDGQDGSQPYAGLTMDAAGNLYGTTRYGGGNQGTNGTAFKLTPKGSSWIYTKLYAFGSDGIYPSAKLVVGPDGSLYGTTSFARAGAGNAGTVFNLKPQPTRCPAASCPWVATVIHTFNGNDGSYPTTIGFDPAGNIYGTTDQGGPDDLGVVYKLAPSNGSWTYSMLAGFANEEVNTPNSGVTLDQAGNLYGTGVGPYPGGIFELTTSGELQILHRFFGLSSGVDPTTGLIFDNAGNLYGMTALGGSGGGGNLFELSPSNGLWILTTLYSFLGSEGNVSSDRLTMDAQGNLYGTTTEDGAYGYGSVFKLTASAGGWTYTDLHDFCQDGPGYCSDGCYPLSDLVFDKKGNLYGTTSSCGPQMLGTYDNGTVWEITP